MSYRLTRRRALAGLSTALVLPLTGRAGPATAKERETARFSHGVASGDPDHQSIVLWTRLSATDSDLNVHWQVARDDAFQQLAAQGTSTTGPERDFTVKVVAQGLEPGQQYFYRFRSGEYLSPIGRSRTLPDGHVESLGLAIASCSNYPFGYFNAYEAIALDPQVELVLHLGDYLYEYGPDGYGAATGTRLGRQHHPEREIVSLTDYRQRHAQYKSDPQSQLMHAAHPLLAIWDDHESTNNPWLGGAENHQPDTEGEWALRRAASLQAYYEWMPIREPEPGRSRADYWRHFRFGDLASLITLETRHSGRSQQIDYDIQTLPSMTAADAQHFLDEVVGDPSRRMLSAEMEQFLAQALRASKQTGEPWRLIGNQIPMARTRSPQLSADDLRQLQQQLDSEHFARAQYYARLGELGLPLYLDPWDGYPAARERFYKLCADTGVRDLLVLTGDSHSFWSNVLHDRHGTRMGLELGTNGISSPGDFQEFGPAAARLMDQRLMDSNPEVAWTDGLHNGYLRLVLQHDRAVADFIAVSTITARQYGIEHLRRIEISRSDEGLRMQ
ncbi:alkaline phosphatase D family protein [Kineobactrum salinum]|uniref:Alkaline phosphatase n=1 Tax=Kineobactrum salinum TaxID=2708301 RepID=A0A6C0TYE5_9GAMM|nr:alkaline phosphatase D family protein [Kineobactrum salinum]QIB64850.1 alkaline phosphatase [Kineobactrum salinum]